jgi:hypothetical protein
MSTSEKPLERSASSSGMNFGPSGRRDDLLNSTTTTTRPRANTGSRTPRMMGLGVPAEKVTSRGLGRKKSNHCLAPPEPVTTNFAGSGATTPEIVVTPVGIDDEGDDDGNAKKGLYLDSSASSFNSNLSALRDDLFSPPLPEPLDEPITGSILLNSNSRARTRRNTGMSEKSVNFGTAEAVGEAPSSETAEGLRIKTVEFADPDPMFHRALGSPVLPPTEAFVEQVGCFRVANLRNDSLGNLPRIVSTPSEETSPNDDECTREGGFTCSSESEGEGQEDREGCARSPPPKITWRRPSAEKWSTLTEQAIAKAASPELSTAVKRPPAVTRKTSAGGNPCSVFSSAATTALCSVHDSEPIISTPGTATANMGNPFEKFGSAETPGGGDKRRGSAAASVRSVQDIIGKSQSASAPSSRRSSAWAIGKGNLGLTIDAWNGGVKGTGN